MTMQNQLVTQPTAAPTRKMMAMFIATVVVNAGAAGMQAGVEFFMPDMVLDLPVQEWVDKVGNWIIVGVPLVTGYFTKERG